MLRPRYRRWRCKRSMVLAHTTILHGTTGVVTLNLRGKSPEAAAATNDATAVRSFGLRHQHSTAQLHALSLVRPDRTPCLYVSILLSRSLAQSRLDIARTAIRYEFVNYSNFLILFTRFITIDYEFYRSALRFHRFGIHCQIQCP